MCQRSMDKILCKGLRKLPACLISLNPNGRENMASDTQSQCEQRLSLYPEKQLTAKTPLRPPGISAAAQPPLWKIKAWCKLQGHLWISSRKGTAENLGSPELAGIQLLGSVEVYCTGDSTKGFHPSGALGSAESDGYC